MSIEKARLYKTATATVSCAEFAAGDFVSISEPWQGDNGLIWFTITKSQHGPLRNPVCYPHNQLTDFCL